MDANTITNLVGSLGFPIVCTIFLIWVLFKMTAMHKEEISELRTSNENNVVKMTEAINNNTTILTSVVNMIENINSKLEEV